MIRLEQKLADYHHALDKYWLDGGKMKIKFTNYLTKGIRRRNSLWLVSKVEGKTVGLFHASIHKKHGICVNQIGDIVDAFVLKEYRGCGMAKAAMQLFAKWFKARKIRMVELSVATLNDIGIKSWQSLGFKEYLKHFKLTL